MVVLDSQMSYADGESWMGLVGTKGLAQRRGGLMRLKGIGAGYGQEAMGGCSCASALVVSTESLKQSQQERFWAVVLGRTAGRTAR